MFELLCHGITGGIKLGERHYFPARAPEQPAFWTRDLLLDTTQQGQIRLVLFAPTQEALDLCLPGTPALQPPLAFVTAPVWPRTMALATAA